MFDAAFIKDEDHILGERFASMNIPNLHYMKIDQVRHFLLHEAPSIQSRFSIMTHNGDYSVTDELLSLAKTIPNMSVWYGQNIECYEDPQVQSIPIGLENSMHFPHVSKRRRLLEAALHSAAHVPSKMVYMNFSMWTNPSARIHAYNSMRDKPWITDECVQATVQENYPQWLHQVLNHHYVLCPRGNGVDTHRTWETLYLGRIPIVLNDLNMRYYKNLPILIVDDWRDITESLLVEGINTFSNVDNFNLDMLRMSWWKSLIRRNQTT